MTERNVTVMRRYSFRLYPIAEQMSALHEQRQMMVDLWNALLQRHEDIHRRTRGQRGVVHCDDRANYTFFDMTAEITELRRECSEWAALSVWSAHRIAKALDEAYKAFFRRARDGAGRQSGYPRYQRRRDGMRIPHLHNLPPGRKSGSGSGCRLMPGASNRNRIRTSVRDCHLIVKGIDGPIHARGKFPIEPLTKKNADIIWRDGKWWFSICVEMAPRRAPGGTATTVEFDLIDGLARINGELSTPDKLIDAKLLAERIDDLKSDRDRRWPRRAPHDHDWQDAQAEVSRLSAHEARLRRECLHVWTTRIVDQASDLTIRMPRISEHVTSARGDAARWGVEVPTVSALNRNTLSYASAMAAAMLKYKAEEAGIRCDVIHDEAPAIAVGEKLVAAGQMQRRARRAIKRRSGYGRDNARDGNGIRLD